MYEYLETTRKILPKNLPPPSELPAGIQDMPPGAQEKGRHLRAWLYRHSTEGVRATSFRPDRHSLIIHGRPVQVPSLAVFSRQVAFFDACAIPPGRDLGPFSFRCASLGPAVNT